jgi:hypothetical protein
MPVQLHPGVRVEFFTFSDGVPPRDIEAHLRTRAALLRLLDEDPLVTELFHTFADLWPIAVLLAALNDVFARECGWQDRAHMYSAPDLYDERQSPHCVEFVARNMAFPWDRLSTFPAAADRVVHDTWSLPRDHPKERWAWLSGDLMRLFVLNLEGEILGRRHLIHYSSRSTSPKIDVSFSTRPNESAEAARRRLKQMYEESDASLGRGEPVRRDGAILNEERLREDVGWFYQRDLRQPPAKVAALARLYDQRVHPAPDQRGSRDHRKTVRDGIARARRLLSEIPA